MTVPVAVTLGHLGDTTKAYFGPTPVSIVFTVFKLMLAMLISIPACSPA